VLRKRSIELSDFFMQLFLATLFRAAIASVIFALGLSGSAFAVEKVRSAGKAVYKKANCVGCHKWHGGGGGGYGGMALSLRETPLDTAGLTMVIRCGRPGTRMPYHQRGVYGDDERHCYDTSAEELEGAMPPRAHYFLKDRDIAAVVEYVQTWIQGRGTPGYDDCVAFWGADARRCKSMAPTRPDNE
jgi:mono/diheme cytochrome c family protein